MKTVCFVVLCLSLLVLVAQVERYNRIMADCMADNQPRYVCEAYAR